MGWKRGVALLASAIVLFLVAWVAASFLFPPAPSQAVAPVPINVLVHANGAISVDGQAYSLDYMLVAIAARATTPDQSRQPIRLYASKDVDYATFSTVRDRIEADGWTDVKRIIGKQPS